ncbi:flagellar hook-basal body complex protein FliE [Inediibacterium massiliense]|uniref:flagellar hook-basal body complex protein FliE n=1 Tax=Inediibacterium massiliense TaxID=1658111 RepID=UPI0006B432F8|nr:flagellar hook-basal body complex protein FliE [Inediibacterium massiliense]
MNINSIMNIAARDTSYDSKKIGDSESFSSFLKDALNKANDYQIESEKMDTLAAMGEIDNVHEVMIAADKSEIALQFTIEVKNKVLDAYKEIMRLQI